MARLGGFRPAWWHQNATARVAWHMAQRCTFPPFVVACVFVMDDGEEKKGPERYGFEQLKNRQVEVRADGIIYKGTLIGADDEWLYLKGNLRWLILPLEKVSNVRLEGQRERLDGKKDVDARFYSDDADG